MCISIGNDLVLRCTQAQAGASHSGAGDARDLAQQIESALDRRVVTGDLQAVATRVLTEAFASDLEDPLIKQLRSAVAAGCKEAASLEAAIHLERNARSALQNVPASKWKEALERAFRAYPALLERPVKDAVAEVSPDVILALLHGGTKKVGPKGLLESALKEDAGKRVLSSLVAPLVLAHLTEEGAGTSGGNGGSSPSGGCCSSDHPSDPYRWLCQRGSPQGDVTRGHIDHP